MDAEEMMRKWQQSSQEAAERIAHWRETHPMATLAEIETMVDGQMQKVRAQMIEDVAQTSPLEQARQAKTACARCPHCGKPMQARGKQQRTLQTQGGQQVTLSRQYQSCPHCGYSFFPPR